MNMMRIFDEVAAAHSPEFDALVAQCQPSELSYGDGVTACFYLPMPGNEGGAKIINETREGCALNYLYEKWRIER
jgi:hypothetical protein